MQTVVSLLTLTLLILPRTGFSQKKNAEVKKKEPTHPRVILPRRHKPKSHFITTIQLSVVEEAHPDLTRRSKAVASREFHNVLQAWPALKQARVEKQFLDNELVITLLSHNDMRPTLGAEVIPAWIHRMNGVLEANGSARFYRAALHNPDEREVIVEVNFDENEIHITRLVARHVPLLNVFRALETKLGPIRFWLSPNCVAKNVYFEEGEGTPAMTVEETMQAIALYLGVKLKKGGKKSNPTYIFSGECTPTPASARPSPSGPRSPQASPELFPLDEVTPTAHLGIRLNPLVKPIKARNQVRREVVFPLPQRVVEPTPSLDGGSE